MGAFVNLSALALEHAIGQAGSLLGLPAVEGAAGAIGRLYTQRFTDHSEKLFHALKKANHHAWQALEVALAGESLWQQCKRLVESGDNRGFHRQVRAFLDAVPEGQLGGDGPAFRARCLAELRAARRAKVFEEALEPKTLARKVGHLAQFADNEGILNAEWHAVQTVAEALPPESYSHLRQLLTLRQGNDPPVLTAAVRYFFRRELESDEELARGLEFEKLQRIEDSQHQAFRAIEGVLVSHGRQMERLLDETYDLLVAAHQVAVTTRDAVLDMREEQQRQAGQMREIYDTLITLRAQADLTSNQLRPHDGLSIRNDGERRAIRALLERFRALPPEQQRRLPAFLNGLGMLHVAAGDFEPARQLFGEAAASAPDPASRAQALYNAYRAALERRDWRTAFTELTRAVELDPDRFAPFPFAKYEPEGILGAGGFGTAFVCRHRKLGSRVVVKSLSSSELERAVDDVFSEASVLDSLNHPAIIRVRDCDYAGEGKERPFFVMDFFDGKDLEEYVRGHGTLTVPQLLQVARVLTEAVGAAHAHGVLHRDIKPSNVLVRREEDRFAVKLIDFGLALKHDTLQEHASSSGRSILESTIAGTRDYAAPEQMGRVPGVPVGPYSDIYGLAKTWCYALFKTSQPLLRHWKNLPEPLAALLEKCLEEAAGDRPATANMVLAQLNRLAGASSSPGPSGYKAVADARPSAPSYPAAHGETSGSPPPPRGRATPHPLSQPGLPPLGLTGSAAGGGKPADAPVASRPPAVPPRYPVSPLAPSASAARPQAEAGKESAPGSARGVPSADLIGAAKPTGGATPAGPDSAGPRVSGSSPLGAAFKPAAAPGGAGPGSSGAMGEVARKEGRPEAPILGAAFSPPGGAPAPTSADSAPSSDDVARDGPAKSPKTEQGHGSRAKLSPLFGDPNRRSEGK